MNQYSTANETISKRHPKAKVLVVDPDESFLDSFRLLIDSENCEMIEACSSDDAVEKAEGKKIDLLITEFMLKTKSSIELFTLIRKSNPGVPIVVMTKYPELISQNDIKRFGGNQLLTKPLESSKVKSIIRGYCNPLHIMN